MSNEISNKKSSHAQSVRKNTLLFAHSWAAEYKETRNENSEIVKKNETRASSVRNENGFTRYLG